VIERAARSSRTPARRSSTAAVKPSHDPARAEPLSAAEPQIKPCDTIFGTHTLGRSWPRGHDILGELVQGGDVLAGQAETGRRHVLLQVGRPTVRRTTKPAAGSTGQPRAGVERQAQSQAWMSRLRDHDAWLTADRGWRRALSGWLLSGSAASPWVRTRPASGRSRAGTPAPHAGAAMRAAWVWRDWCCRRVRARPG
jgi:hypothetical protein